MKPLLAIQGIMLIFFVVIGNGLRSMSMASTMMSLGEFASFLNISVDRTHILIEALICGSIVALALAPFLISRRSARKVALWAAALAAVSYVIVGITLHMRPSLITREVLVLSAFLIGGSAVAFFAPLAQIAIAGVNDDKSRMALTMIWTGAQPIAFLLTPQLIKFIAFDIGIGNFFYLLALFPILFLMLTPAIFKHLPKEATEERLAVKPLLLAGFLLVLFAFQGWSAAMSLSGITNPITLALLAFAVALGIAAFATRSRWMPPTSDLPQGAVFLLVLLFLLQLPTTGLYDHAYLVRHLCSNDLLADRTSLGGISQIMGVFGTGALLLRWPTLRAPFLAFGLLLVFIGTLMIMPYPYLPLDSQIFFISKMTASLGTGMATTVLVNEIVMRCAGNRVLMLAPAFAIVLGTEVGIEVLELIFELVMLVQHDETVAYQGVFLAQSLILLIPLAMLIERRLISRFSARHAGSEAF